MATLVLTVVGDDRAGLVSALAEQVAAHRGNWEQSELAELAGAFAGIVLISVPDDRVDELTRAVQSLEGLLRVTAHTPPAAHADDDAYNLTFTVLGNDRPGIVRDVTTAVAAHALSIDGFRSRTLDAPMAGGTLFEATVQVRVPSAADADAITSALERLAGEIQVDLSLG
ncbi:amino acid-binding ACT protein [Microbacterium saccharophilum]|uniref:Amino acid-binding ACT protein n=1 Tax=Microbacterium saccharophilum TaxID=1213358 RepID=A0A5C8HVX6_9MICO|nr:ACT domain-containing protein [Microbacterium saccharophilum]TXK09089.1 amino acid-binding ACT protein [Microbacterium saccharophilum]GEP47747.1 phosphoserine phosphatase [Microbacterium saccharophilum]